MIKEKVFELLDCLDEYRKLDREVVLMAERRAALSTKYNELKQKIGRIIEPLSTERKNIIIEKEGKFYSIYYNRRLMVAEIYECLTDKEADIKLSLKKLVPEK